VIQVHCAEFGWNAYTIGPILPVIPWIGGNGSCYPYLSVKVQAVSAEHPVSLRFGVFRVRVPHDPAEHLPLNWTREEDRGRPTYLRTVQPGGSVELAQGEFVWLYFGAEYFSTTAFDLVCGLDPDGEEKGESACLHFEQETTPFLFHMP